jgi:hypothetical protein
VAPVVIGNCASIAGRGRRFSEKNLPVAGDA